MTGGQGPPPHPIVGTYAGPELHLRVTTVIDEMMNQYNINPNKIYTLGYSMGGIDAVNYAARHVDPEGHMIAAAWSWSGTLCAEDSSPSCILLPPCPPDPLSYIAASAVQTINCGCPGGTPNFSFVVNESLGWNMEHIWLTTTEATSDICHVTCPSLPMQVLTFNWAKKNHHTHLANYGATHNDPSSFDPVQICDFFRGKSVSLPSSATLTVAVEDVRYFYFDVLRRDPAFTGVFGWSFAGRQLDITDLNNLSSLTMDVDGGVDCPLDSINDITINVTPDPLDLLGTDIVLDHFDNGPGTTVWVNGSLATAGTHYAWTSSTSLILFGQLDATFTNWFLDVP